MIRFAASAICLLASLSCFAAEDEVAQAFQQQMKVKPDSVSKTPMEGVYEVIAGGRFFYTNPQVTYFVQGNLFSVAGEKDLTAEKKFKMLPFDLAVKQVKGNGKNVLVTFEDPNCGYCKKLGKELAGLSDITIYTFMVPILGPDSDTKARNILCAGNSSKAWTEWMNNGAAPQAADTTCNPSATLTKTRTLFRQQGAQGTPYLMFADGQVAGGYIPASEITRRMAAASRQ